MFKIGLVRAFNALFLGRREVNLTLVLLKHKIGVLFYPKMIGSGKNGSGLNVVAKNGSRLHFVVKKRVVD